MKMHRRCANTAFACAAMGLSALLSLPSGAVASDIIYTPINPSFGGHPLNSSHLLGLANAQNEAKRKADEARAKALGSVNSVDRFLQLLQARLYSSLAQQVSEAIFGENAQQSGTIKFNDQEVSFVNTGTEIQLSITDFTTGQVTEIIVPTLVTTQ